MRALQASGFLLGAVLLAWVGALADTFVFPMDEVSSRALGSPEFAYGPVLMSRLLVALAGALVFAVSTMVLPQAFQSRGHALGKGAFCGAFYSVSLVALLHLAIWAEMPAAVFALWAVAILLPIGAAWLCSRGALHNNELQRTRPAQAMEPRR
jgi:hypothetical protein